MDGCMYVRMYIRMCICTCLRMCVKLYSLHIYIQTALDDVDSIQILQRKSAGFGRRIRWDFRLRRDKVSEV